jgi:hypothetical protein
MFVRIDGNNMNMTVEERYKEWLRLSCELAQAMNLEIEFTTRGSLGTITMFLL